MRPSRQLGRHDAESISQLTLDQFEGEEIHYDWYTVHSDRLHHTCQISAECLKHLPRANSLVVHSPFLCQSHDILIPVTSTIIHPNPQRQTLGKYLWCLSRCYLGELTDRSGGKVDGSLIRRYQGDILIKVAFGSDSTEGRRCDVQLGPRR